MVKIERADRIRNLPPYLFAEIDRVKRIVRERGVDIIDLGVGDPDLPTPAHIVRAGQEAAADPANHQYPSYEGMLSFRQAVANWYAKRFGVKVEPATEVVATIGSKEGVAHFPLAYIDPGDVVLMPDPGYPVYHTSTLFCGGESWFMPLTKANGFIPDLDAVPEEVRKRAKIMFLNHPGNPTGACADLAFFDKVVRYANEWNIIVCHDNAYSEMAFDGYRPPSFL
ncbi:MAG: aminotransferase class I/II-fold pyridoxal phosphate-dependent enzyme, partial [Candidatus Methylomirabilis sp.]|nr:aminotransferase class I/II-fold pyridoxal phosphate-dependent enzyme [Deltaproteobacteria bacterium]